MATRSIISVDVDDAKFVRFQALYAKYTEELGKTPNAWKAAGKESAAMATQFERMAAALMAQNALSAESKDADEKRLKQLSTSERLWTSMSKSASSIARSVLDVGTGLLKWGGLIGGAALFGSMFGIDRMARDVSNSRRSAMGQGLSIGEAKAFGVNFERLLDPNFLSQVAEMKMDPSKAGPLYTMGVGTSGSTEDTAIALLKAMRARAVSTPIEQLGLLDTQTGLSAGTEEWRRLHDMKNPEFNSLMAGNRRDIAGLGIGDGTAQGWQNFTTQMERAGATIFKVFVQGLSPLSGPLTHLSEAFTKFVTQLFPASGNGPVQKGIENLGHWLEGLSGKLSSQSFLTSVDSFVSNTGQLADAMQTIVDAVQHPGSTLGKAVVGAVKEDFIGGHQALLAGAKYGVSLLGKAGDWVAKQAALAQLSQLDSAYGLPAGTLAYVWGKESSFGFNPQDQPGKNGAQGPFQIKPAVQGGINAHNFSQSSNRAGQLIKEELARYHGDIAKAIAAYHLGDPAMDQTLSKYGSNWRKQVPYVSDLSPQKGISVTINNNTGGSTTASVNALAAGS